VAYGERSGGFTGADPTMVRNYSEKSAVAIDDFVRKTVEEQLKRAVALLKEHKGKLEELAQILLQKENMSFEEFEEIFLGKVSAKEVEAKLEAEDRKAEEEAKAEAQEADEK
jgi:ATP-dependent Zn protease